MSHLMSHPTNLNAFLLTPVVQICRVRSLKERNYRLLVAICDVRDVKVLVAQGPLLSVDSEKALCFVWRAKRTTREL